MNIADAHQDKKQAMWRRLSATFAYRATTQMCQDATRSAEPSTAIGLGG